MARRVLSRAAAIRVFEEIETGRGGIAELVRERPAAGTLSREALSGAGGVLTVFRAVAVLDGGALRREAVASTSLDWRVPADMLPDFPLVMGGDAFVDNRPHLLRYELPLDRVLAHVPTLVGLALEALPDWRGRKVADRWGGRVPLSGLAKLGMREQEVVADLSGLAPEVLAFDNTVEGRLDMSLVRPLGEGRLRTGEECFDHLWRGSSFVFCGDRGAEVARLDRLAAAVRALVADRGSAPDAGPPGPAPR